MAANPTENPLKSQNFQTNQNAKRTVLAAPFAFLFSIAFYVSVFYFFSSSPSTLVTDIKFWFFVSNTLILIIAADYGAFSSSKDKKLDFYEEYSLHRHATRTTLLEKSLSTTGQTAEENDVTETVNEIPEKTLEVVRIEPVPDHKTKHQEPKTIRRSKSERVKRVGNKRTCILHRLNTGKHQEYDELKPEHEHDEFFAMSNEELNRRVEEFIEKFNRQIRLQV